MEKRPYYNGSILFVHGRFRRPFLPDACFFFIEVLFICRFGRFGGCAAVAGRLPAGGAQGGENRGLGLRFGVAAVGGVALLVGRLKTSGQPPSE